MNYGDSPDDHLDAAKKHIAELERQRDRLLAENTALKELRKHCHDQLRGAENRATLFQEKERAALAEAARLKGELEDIALYLKDVPCCGPCDSYGVCKICSSRHAAVALSALKGSPDAQVDKAED